MCRDFALDYEVELSTRPDEFLGEIATWDHASRSSRARSKRQAARSGWPPRRQLRPKIDFTSRTRSAGWRMRDDPALPDPQRFGLKPSGPTTPSSRSSFTAPFRQLRAVRGAAARTRGRVSALAGPLQVIVLPDADRHLDYAASVESTLAAAGLRVELDRRRIGPARSGRRSSRKLRAMLVIGDREATGHRRGPEPDRGDGRPDWTRS